MSPKDCSVSVELPVPILLVALCFLSSFTFSVYSSGAYMQALRVRKNHTFHGGKSDAPDSIYDFGINVKIPPIKENPHLEEIDERYSKCNGIDIREITIPEVQLLFARNELTSVQLTNCYIERIQQMNKVLGAVNEINQEAIADALRADLARKSNRGNLGPLHGVPVLIKENIATNDMMETTAGSLALVGIRPKNDADVIKALRKAGAIILGKANLSEFAYFRGTNIPSGWSGRGGYTRNAYNLNESPEGSSSGSAVSVSANLATVSIGTETDGSLIAPASIAGICTIKPTLGKVPTRGVIPISHNQDAVGPMARTVIDLAIVLDAIVPDDENRAISYTQQLQEQTKGKFRIGVLRYPFWDPTVINSTNLEHQLPLLEQLLQKMKESYQINLIDPVVDPENNIRNISSNKELMILEHDFKHDMNKYLRNEVISQYQIPPPSKNINYNRYFRNHALKKISCLQDIIQFNEQNPTPEGYNQELLILSEATDGLRNKTYKEALNSNRDAAREMLSSILDTYDLDAIITPSDSRTNGTIGEELQEAPSLGYSIAAIAGYPSVNIPAGIGLQGVPFGVSFIGRPNSEGKLLAVAYTVEQMSLQRRKPEFLI